MRALRFSHAYYAVSSVLAAYLIANKVGSKAHRTGAAPPCAWRRGERELDLPPQVRAPSRSRSVVSSTHHGRSDRPRSTTHHGTRRTHHGGRLLTTSGRLPAGAASGACSAVPLPLVLSGCEGGDDDRHGRPDAHGDRPGLHGHLQVADLQPQEGPAAPDAHRAAAPVRRHCPGAEVGRQLAHCHEGGISQSH